MQEFQRPRSDPSASLPKIPERIIDRDMRAVLEPLIEPTVVTLRRVAGIAAQCQSYGDLETIVQTEGLLPRFTERLEALELLEPGAPGTQPIALDYFLNRMNHFGDLARDLEGARTLSTLKTAIDKAIEALPSMEELVRDAARVELLRISNQIHHAEDMINGPSDHAAMEVLRKISRGMKGGVDLNETNREIEDLLPVRLQALRTLANAWRIAD